VIGKKVLFLIIAAVYFSQLFEMQASRAAIKGSAISKNNNNVHDAYILGPGDTLMVEVIEVPELSGSYSIGPDGTIYLPRLRALYVEGLTVEELRYFLTQQYKPFIKAPQIYLYPSGYRPVRIYIGGEVGRPGYYTLSNGSGPQILLNPQSSNQNIEFKSRTSESLRQGVTAKPSLSSLTRGVAQDSLVKWPTLFDGIRAANGVTSYSNLGKVQIVRKLPLSAGGGKARATVNFLDLLTNGDERVNIRLYDGDVINVERSNQVMIEQLLTASRTNLSPEFIEVYVTGRVKEPGAQSLPQGTTLNQAIANAGGLKLLRGNIEFVRFTRDGATDKRNISLDKGAASGSYNNPILMSGDVIRVNDSVFSATVNVLNEVAGPAVGIYSVYSLFKP
jgi:polysaccharide export outer membrane protein